MQASRLRMFCGSAEGRDQFAANGGIAADRLSGFALNFNFAAGGFQFELGNREREDSVVGGRPDGAKYEEPQRANAIAERAPRNRLIRVKMWFRV